MTGTTTNIMLDNVHGLEVGHSVDGGFFLRIVTTALGNPAYILQFGMTPTALVLFMRANFVKHFDYHASLANDTTKFSEFLNAAETVGFSV